MNKADPHQLGIALRAIKAQSWHNSMRYLENIIGQAWQAGFRSGHTTGHDFTDQLNGGQPHTQQLPTGPISHNHNAPPEAARIIAYALHLRTYGENAPGGDETWADWDHMAETYLRALPLGEHSQ